MQEKQCRHAAVSGPASLPLEDVGGNSESLPEAEVPQRPRPHLTGTTPRCAGQESPDGHR